MMLGACVSACGLALALYDVAAALAKTKTSAPAFDDEPDVWPGDDDEIEGVLAQVNVWKPKAWRARA